MKKLNFKPEDFDSEANYRDVHASTAQLLFDDWYAENIESAPTIYGGHADGIWSNMLTYENDKVAKAVLIESIEDKK